MFLRVWFDPESVSVWWAQEWLGHCVCGLSSESASAQRKRRANTVRPRRGKTQWLPVWLFCARITGTFTYTPHRHLRLRLAKSIRALGIFLYLMCILFLSHIICHFSFCIYFSASHTISSEDETVTEKCQSGRRCWSELRSAGKSVQLSAAVWCACEPAL